MSPFQMLIKIGPIGALGALLISVARRKLTLYSPLRVLIETGHATAAHCFLLVAAHLYARLISVSAIPGALEFGLATDGLGFYGLVALYVALLIVLGTILDSASIMLILVPILTVVLRSMEMAGTDVDSIIWFGIITVIAVEIGLLTPPVGLACFAIHKILNDPHVSLSDVFHGAAPFAATTFVVLLLIIVFPWLATGLL